MNLIDFKSENRADRSWESDFQEMGIHLSYGSGPVELRTGGRLISLYVNPHSLIYTWFDLYDTGLLCVGSRIPGEYDMHQYHCQTTSEQRILLKLKYEWIEIV